MKFFQARVWRVGKRKAKAVVFWKSKRKEKVFVFSVKDDIHAVDSSCSGFDMHSQNDILRSEYGGITSNQNSDSESEWEDPKWVKDENVRTYSERCLKKNIYPYTGEKEQTKQDKDKDSPTGFKNKQNKEKKQKKKEKKRFGHRVSVVIESRDGGGMCYPFCKHEQRTWKRKFRKESKFPDMSKVSFAEGAYYFDREEKQEEEEEEEEEEEQEQEQKEKTFYKNNNIIKKEEKKEEKEEDNMKFKIHANNKSSKEEYNWNSSKLNEETLRDLNIYEESIDRALNNTYKQDKKRTTNKIGVRKYFTAHISTKPSKDNTYDISQEQLHSTSSFSSATGEC